MVISIIKEEIQCYDGVWIYRDINEKTIAIFELCNLFVVEGGAIKLKIFRTRIFLNRRETNKISQGCQIMIEMW